MGPQELLLATEKAIGDASLHEQHLALITKRERERALQMVRRRPPPALPSLPAPPRCAGSCRRRRRRCLLFFAVVRLEAWGARGCGGERGAWGQRRTKCPPRRPH